MEFNPNNQIVKLCLQGMNLEGANNPREAEKVFLTAWNEATNDIEKFIAAHFVIRQQQILTDKLKWIDTAVQLAEKINNDYVNGILPSLYLKKAKCYEESGDPEMAKKNYEMAASFRVNLSDKGPFYHGTRADLQTGESLTAGFRSNYHSEVIMNHTYFTALISGAGLAAALAKGEGQERVYIVEPTGSFEDDPNVTDKKFPGNPTRSYRTRAPLKIVGELTDWIRQTPEEIQSWHVRLARIKKEEIIN